MKKIAAVTLLILVNTALSFIMYLLMVLSLIECISPLMILLLFAGHISRRLLYRGYLKGTGSSASLLSGSAPEF